jgi:molybdopterin synthase sulfur carrier subunit
MKIQLKLYATLSRFSPNGAAGASFEVELPEGATLQDLVNQMKIPAEEAKITFCNGLMQSLDWNLKPGDEIGIFPPIGGG